MSTSVFPFLFFAHLSTCLQLSGPGKGSSQFFLDTADIDLWNNYLKLGIFYGVTTNPILLERARVPCDIPSLQYLTSIAIDKYGLNSIMFQTWGDTAVEMVENGIKLAVLSDKVVVKIPLTRSGVEAASILKKNNIPICMTACYAQHQVFTSAGLRADYVAPYLGRMIDMGKDGLQEVIQMQRIVEGLKANTRVFVASLRTSSQLAELAAAGCDTFTFSPQVADSLFGVEATEDAARDFEQAVLTSRIYEESFREKYSL